MIVEVGSSAIEIPIERHQSKMAIVGCLGSRLLAAAESR